MRGGEGGGGTKGDRKSQSGREGSVRRHICERVRGDVRRDRGLITMKGHLLTMSHH